MMKMIVNRKILIVCMCLILTIAILTLTSTAMAGYPPTEGEKIHFMNNGGWLWEAPLTYSDQYVRCGYRADAELALPAPGEYTFQIETNDDYDMSTTTILFTGYNETTGSWSNTYHRNDEQCSKTTTDDGTYLYKCENMQTDKAQIRMPTDYCDYSNTGGQIYYARTWFRMDEKEPDTYQLNSVSTRNLRGADNLDEFRVVVDSPKGVGEYSTDNTYTSHVIDANFTACTTTGEYFVDFIGCSRNVGTYDYCQKAGMWVNFTENPEKHISYFPETPFEIGVNNATTFTANVMGVDYKKIEWTVGTPEGGEAEKDVNCELSDSNNCTITFREQGNYQVTAEIISTCGTTIETHTWETECIPRETDVTVQLEKIVNSSYSENLSNTETWVKRNGIITNVGTTDANGTYTFTDLETETEYDIYVDLSGEDPCCDTQEEIDLLGCEEIHVDQITTTKSESMNIWRPVPCQQTSLKSTVNVTLNNTKTNELMTQETIKLYRWLNGKWQEIGRELTNAKGVAYFKNITTFENTYAEYKVKYLPGDDVFLTATEQRFRMKGETHHRLTLYTESYTPDFILELSTANCDEDVFVRNTQCNITSQDDNDTYTHVLPTGRKNVELPAFESYEISCSKNNYIQQQQYVVNMSSDTEQEICMIETEDTYTICVAAENTTDSILKDFTAEFTDTSGYLETQTKKSSETGLSIIGFPDEMACFYNLPPNVVYEVDVSKQGYLSKKATFDLTQEDVETYKIVELEKRDIGDYEEYGLLAIPLVLAKGLFGLDLKMDTTDAFVSMAWIIIPLIFVVMMGLMVVSSIKDVFGRGRGKKRKEGGFK